jgi:hypothetical protein
MIPLARESLQVNGLVSECGYLPVFQNQMIFELLISGNQGKKHKDLQPPLS